ncbi:MAG: methylated-DNA--[protein]-cysteine S-methyltransferase [Anaerolineae bacterium]
MITVRGTVTTESFFERVYEVVRQIPFGRVATYGQIARLLGEPHAARTVGWAMRASMDPAVPWHRVLNAQGLISAEGTRREGPLQRALLEEEGIRFDERGRVDLGLHRWEAPPEASPRPA